MRDLRDADPIEFEDLMTDSEGSGVDPSACPACDGTLVPESAIEPAGDDGGRLARHCSRCDTTLEQGWEVQRVAAVDDDRTFDTQLDNCPDCDVVLEPVGNFFDHRDGSGRQELACTECGLAFDEWWDYRGRLTDDQ
jgi:uncharacterized protein with PIN domain